MSKKNETAEEDKSIAMQFVGTLKTQANRWFVCWLITFVTLVCLAVYIIYLLNDTAIIETTETTQEITDVHTIENSTISNGE